MICFQAYLWSRQTGKIREITDTIGRRIPPLFDLNDPGGRLGPYIYQVQSRVTCNSFLRTTIRLIREKYEDERLKVVDVKVHQKIIDSFSLMFLMCFERELLICVISVYIISDAMKVIS